MKGLAAIERSFLVMMLAVLSLGSGGCATAEAQATKYPATGSERFELVDRIDSPVYAWPRTLLSFRVDFSNVKVAPDNLFLVDADSGKTEPMQLSDTLLTPSGKLKFATVSFFSDLPSGGRREFDLKIGHAPALSKQGLAITRTAQVIVVDNGNFKLRMPVSITGPLVNAVPGPIIALNQGRGWIGSSTIESPKLRVKAVATRILEQGPLFDLVEVTYSFTGGAAYVADVKSVLGYPFVQLSEKMSGLSPDDHVCVVDHWTGFFPNKRFAANGWLMPPDGLGIGQAVTTSDYVEEPHWWPRSVTEDPSREMIFHLASFEGNQPRDAVPAMSFWDDRPGGQELGVFVPDTRDWDDDQYMIWQPTTRLQVAFRYKNSVLDWTWPLITGTRTTDIELSDAAEGQRVVDAQCAAYGLVNQAEKNSLDRNCRLSLEDYPERYSQWLRSWYGGLNLDRVKDWVLSYPAARKTTSNPFPLEPTVTPAAVDTLVFSSQLMLYPLGLDLASMNITHRVVRTIVDDYLQVQSNFTPDQKSRIDALLLLSAYVNTGEDEAPIRTCVTGTPNMSADGFSVPSEIGLLYPEHPDGPIWRDQFQKTMDILGCYYTRPNDPVDQALGGRWTESIATYNWAYLTPTEAANTADELTDGINRSANPWTALKGRWMVDSATAPIYNPNPYWRQNFKAPRQIPPSLPSSWTEGMPLDQGHGFDRQYPAYGAHGSGTAEVIPAAVPVLADTLMHYDPLTAEHLFWLYDHVASSGSGEFGETPWDAIKISQVTQNNGTEPSFKSCKYTGNGIILRAGVDTPDELSIHLEQVDAGPNYRWGNNGEGSSGLLYFFAGGKVWTGHERENAGDHTNDDTLGTTTFGVLKDGRYKSIGENLLTQPLYDLGPEQFAEIVPRQGASAYSWPQYVSRSVMLVGTDYFILVDDVNQTDRTPTRFSWFQAKDLPFPKLVFLQPLSAREDSYTQVSTAMSKGILRDGDGPSIVLVTSKPGVDMDGMNSTPLPFLDIVPLSEYSWIRSAKPVEGVYRVHTATSHDIVFRATSEISYNAGGEQFSGEAGVIRHFNDGSTELALFKGSTIAAGGLTVSIPKPDGVGVSARITAAGALSGYCYAPKSSMFALTVAKPSTMDVYVDGVKTAEFDGKSASVALPAGRHVWEATARMPKPIPPTIERAVNVTGGADIIFTSSPSATKYDVQLSKDGGATWSDVANTTGNEYTVSGLTNGTKVHVRILALNPDETSDPSDQYPIYVSDKSPAAPDGLSLILSKNTVTASWGEILGAGEYRLYRKTLPAGEWKLIYRGLDRTFTDTAAKGTVPPTRYPGRDENPGANPAGTLYAYSVSAVNGNGEGYKSNVVVSDPTSWLNWWPQNQTREFKRQTGFWLPPYVLADQSPPLHYPSE